MTVALCSLCAIRALYVWVFDMVYIIMISEVVRSLTECMTTDAIRMYTVIHDTHAYIS